MANPGTYGSGSYGGGTYGQLDVAVIQAASVQQLSPRRRRHSVWVNPLLGLFAWLLP